MKKTLFAVIMALTWLNSSAQQSTLMMTFEDCLMYAMDKSYGRQSVVLNEESRSIVYDQSKLERLPNLTGSASQNVTHVDSATWNGTYRVATEIPLFQGGQITNTIKQNKLTLEQTRLKTAQYDNELTIQILQAFLNALGNEELLKYQMEILNASTEQERQGKIRSAEGDILESDYLMLQAQLVADRNSITETTITRDNSLLALKNLLSMNLEQSLMLIYPDTTAIYDMMQLPQRSYVIERSVENLPDLKISDYTVEIAQTGLKISKASFYPTLSLSGNLSTGARDFDNYGSQLSNGFTKTAGLSLSVPIFNKGRTKSNVAQSKIELQRAELNRLQAEMDIRQTLMNEYGNVEAASSKYNSSKMRENAYFQSFKVYRELFGAGSITPVDLLQQQNNYIGAMNDYIQSKYGFILKRKILDVYMGNQVTM